VGKTKTRRAKSGGAKSGRARYATGSNSNYLDKLDEDASREPYLGLASACSMVLQGEGANSLKSECLATISWQETQMMAAMSVIDFLLYKDLISEPLDFKTAMTVSVDDSFVASLWTEFRSIQELEEILFISRMRLNGYCKSWLTTGLTQPSPYMI
jgi:hypothetical protein